MEERKAEEARKAEEERKAAEERKAEAARKAEEEKKAEEERKAAEEAEAEQKRKQAAQSALGSKPNLGSKPKIGGFSKPFVVGRNLNPDSNLSLPSHTKSPSPKSRYDDAANTNTVAEEKPMGFLERARLAKKTEHNVHQTSESVIKTQKANEDLDSI